MDLSGRGGRFPRAAGGPILPCAALPDEPAAEGPEVLGTALSDADACGA